MTSLDVLLTAAVSIALVHTLIGIDHTVPFVALGRARGWSLKRQLAITAACGLGHVLSSVILGTLGISLGAALSHLEWIEASRGAVAAWLLIGFGLAYAGWSVVRRLRPQPPPGQVHAHPGGLLHAHERSGRHRHRPGAPSLTFWSLFLIFVLGPCEPLIPLLMAPALEHGPWAAALVAAVFGVVTIGTMLTVVILLTLGLRLTALRRLEAHAHTLAGLAVASSGLAIQLFGV